MMGVIDNLLLVALILSELYLQTRQSFAGFFCNKIGTIVKRETKCKIYLLPGKYAITFQEQIEWDKIAIYMNHLCKQYLYKSWICR